MDRLLHEPCTCPPNTSWGIYESPRGLQGVEKYLFRPKSYQVVPGNVIIPPPFQPASTFPLERLCPEIRAIIYEMHFFQRKDPGSRGEFCPAADWCPNRVYNNLVPVRKLLLVSRLIYKEAMPVFYRKPLRFNNLPSLNEFLETIGPAQRACLQNINFGWTGFDASKTFMHLGMCQGLRNLVITIKEPELGGEDGELMELMGLVGLQRLLASVRGLHGVVVELAGCPRGVAFESFVQAVGVLKLPRDSVVEDQLGFGSEESEEWEVSSRIAECEANEGPERFFIPPRDVPSSFS